jgi:hypothetical protein
MGYSYLEAQYLSIPVYAVGGLSFLGLAFVSDKLTIRGAFIALANIFGIVGYILILSPTRKGVKFFGTFLYAMAVYNGPGLNLTCLNVNVAPHYTRAMAIGVQKSLANTARVVAGQIYRTPPYALGNAFSVGALWSRRLSLPGSGSIHGGRMSRK